MRARNVSLFADSGNAGVEGSPLNLGRHASSASVNGSSRGGRGFRTDSTASRLSIGSVGDGSIRVDSAHHLTAASGDCVPKRVSSTVHLLSPSPSVSAIATPPLPSRNGSKVFPTLVLAQRSASVLMRHRSTLQEFARKRSNVSSEAQQQRQHGGGSSTDERGASSPSPGGVASATAGSLLGARRDSTGSALEQISRAASSAGFTNDEWLGQCGALHHRQPVALKTVGMAMLMLVRIHRAVRKRRREVAAAQQRSAGAANSNDDVATSTPAASLPTTARQRGPQTPSVTAAQRSTLAAVTATSVTAKNATATATAAHPADILVGLPHVLTQGSFASGTSSAPPIHREASLAGSSSSTSDDDDDDERRKLDDDISVASTNSNDLIEEDDGAQDSDEEVEQHLHNGGGGGGGFLSDAFHMPVVAHRAKFFPPPQDIAQLPEPIQKNIERRARRSLCRFVAVYRFHRYLKQRKQRRTKFSLSAVPEGALETSSVLRGWPAPLIDEAFSSGYIQSCFPNSYVVYPNEPNSAVVFLLSGTLLELSRTNAAVKRMAPHRNATVMGTYTTPSVLRDTAAIVEDSRSREFGLYALTACSVAFVSATRIAEVFRKAVVAEPWNAQLLALCSRYRNLRRDRTLEFLEASYARLTAADSVLLQQLDAHTTTTTTTTAAAASYTGGRGATTKRGGGDRSNGGLLPPAPPGMSDYQLALRSSPLFQRLTREQERLILPRLLPMSFIEGDEILSKKDDDFRNLYFILRGSVVSVSRYRDTGDGEDDGSNTRRKRSRRSNATSSPRGTGGASGGGGSATASEWRTMVFSRWTSGQSVGDKAIYFQEPPVFTLMAETNCDAAVLKRSVLMNILETSDRVGLKACIASGAFLVRASDPRVRLRLQSVRAIPCVEAAVSEGLVTEAFVRELHSKFSIHVFPANELICSASETVKQIVVVSTGKALVDPTGPIPYALPPGLPIGGAVLCNMRWRVAVLAITECEGWVLSLEQFLSVCKQHRVDRHMRRISQEQYRLMMRTDAAESTVMEVPTPQAVVMSVLAAAGDAASKAKQSSFVVQPSKRLLEQRSFFQNPPPGMPLPPPPTTNRTKQKDTAATAAAAAVGPQNRVAATAQQQIPGGGSDMPRFCISVAEYAADGTATPSTPPPSTFMAAGGGSPTRRLSTATSYSDASGVTRDDAFVGDAADVDNAVTSQCADREPSLVPSLSIPGATDASHQPLAETSRGFGFQPSSSRLSTCLSASSSSLGDKRSTRWLNYMRALVRSSTSNDEFGNASGDTVVAPPLRLRCSPFRDEQDAVSPSTSPALVSPDDGRRTSTPEQDGLSSPSYCRPQSAAAALGGQYSPTRFYKARLVERIRRRTLQTNAQHLSSPLLLPPRPSTAGLTSSAAVADASLESTVVNADVKADAPQCDAPDRGTVDRPHSSMTTVVSRRRASPPTWQRSTSAPHSRPGALLTENRNTSRVGTFAWCRSSPCTLKSLRLSASAFTRSVDSRAAAASPLGGH